MTGKVFFARIRNVCSFHSYQYTATNKLQSVNYADVIIALQHRQKICHVCDGCFSGRVRHIPPGPDKNKVICYVLKHAVSNQATS